MSLATEHRPTSFDEIVGNKATIKALTSLLQRSRKKFPHAILLTGPHGCGKTTIGRILSEELGAQSGDYREVDTADFRGIDTIRDIRKQIRLRPQDPKSTCRVWLLDECHMIGKGGDSSTNEAQNAMLKMLEDTPSHVYFILCTTDPQKLRSTIRSRCTQFAVETLSEKEMGRLLKKISRKEKILIPQEVRELIAEQSLGHPRDALQLLQKILGLDEDEMEEVVFAEAAKQNAAIELARALIAKEPWKKVARILTGLQNEKEESMRHMVLKYCNTILLKGKNGQAFIVMDEFEQPFYNSGKPGLTLACYKAIHAE